MTKTIATKNIITTIKIMFEAEIKKHTNETFTRIRVYIRAYICRNNNLF